MADKKITIILDAKNNTKAGLNGASKNLEDFSKKGAGISGLLKKAAGIGAVIVILKTLKDAVVNSISAYMAQEKAERNLADAINMHGESVAKLMPKMNEFSNALLDQVGVGDEVTMQRMANLKSMGMETAQLEAGAKAVAALVRAGMGEEAAQRALIAAHEGNFEALGRYIPALKTAKDETEKARAVNEFISKQFSMMKSDLNTTGGAWSLLKNRVGDFAEESGRKLSKFLRLKEMFTGLGNAIKNLTPDNSEDIKKMSEEYDKADKKAGEKFDLAKADEVKAEEEATKKKIELAKLETEAKRLENERAAINWRRQLEENEKIAAKSVKQFVDGEKQKRKAIGTPTELKRYGELQNRAASGGFMFKSEKDFMTEMNRRKREFEARGEETPEQAADRKRFEQLKRIQQSGKGQAGLGLKDIGGTKIGAKDKEFFDAFQAIENAKQNKAVAENNLKEIEKTDQVQRLDDIIKLLDQNLKEQLKLSQAG